MNELLTPEDIAAILKINRITVVRALKAGRIPGGFKVQGQWRLDRADLDAYIERLKQDAKKRVK